FSPRTFGLVAWVAAEDCVAGRLTAGVARAPPVETTTKLSQRATAIFGMNRLALEVSRVTGTVLTEEDHTPPVHSGKAVRFRPGQHSLEVEEGTGQDITRALLTLLSLRSAFPAATGSHPPDATVRCGDPASSSRCERLRRWPRDLPCRSSLRQREWPPIDSNDRWRRHAHLPSISDRPPARTARRPRRASPDDEHRARTL